MLRYMQLESSETNNKQFENTLCRENYIKEILVTGLKRLIGRYVNAFAINDVSGKLLQLSNLCFKAVKLFTAQAFT